MNQRALTDSERVASLREALRAGNGNWHDITALWSIQDDLDWLLANAERFITPRSHAPPREPDTVITCDGWRPRLKRYCTSEARWAICHVSRLPGPGFVRCSGCARTYRRDSSFRCVRLDA